MAILGYLIGFSLFHKDRLCGKDVAFFAFSIVTHKKKTVACLFKRFCADYSLPPYQVFNFFFMKYVSRREHRSVTWMLHHDNTVSNWTRSLSDYLKKRNVQIFPTESFTRFSTYKLGCVYKNEVNSKIRLNMSLCLWGMFGIAVCFTSELGGKNWSASPLGSFNPQPQYLRIAGWTGPRNSLDASKGRCMLYPYDYLKRNFSVIEPVT